MQKVLPTFMGPKNDAQKVLPTFMGK